MSAVFTFNDARLFEKTFTVIITASAGAFALIGTVIFVVKNKIPFRFRAPSVGLFAMLIAGLLGGITTGYFGSTGYLLGLLATGAPFVAVLIIANAFSGEDLTRELSIAATAVCVVLIAQTLTFYLSADDVIQSMLKKNLDVGWGISNNVALVLLFLSPFSLSLAQKSDIPFVPTTIFALSSATILFTFSRGCIIIMMLTGLAAAVYTVVKAKKRLQVILTFAGTAVISAVAVLAAKDVLAPVIKLLAEKGLTDNGRYDLWLEAIDDWLNSSLASGAGFGYGSPYSGWNYFKWYHSSPLQALANFGIIGLSAFLTHIIQRGVYLVRLPHGFRFYAVISAIGAGAYGLIDVTYFTPYFLFPMIIILAVTYAARSPKDNRPNRANIFGGRYEKV